MLIEENSTYRRFNRLWHALAALATLMLGYYVSQNEKKESGKGMFGACFYSTLTFLIGWAINLGMTIWVSFVAGPVMYKILDRHIFSHIQGTLFPIYFALLGIISFVQLGIFLRTKGLVNLNNAEYIAAASIGASFVSGLLNSLFLTPVINKLISQRIRMEKEEGVVAPNIGSKLGQNSQYKQLSKQFGIYHGISQLLNLTSLAGNVFLAYYISLDLLHGSWAMNKVE